MTKKEYLAQLLKVLPRLEVEAYKWEGERGSNRDAERFHYEMCVAIRERAKDVQRRIHLLKMK